MKHQKAIIVTGAAGMIGSGIVRHLNDLGYKNLILVDDLKRGEKWKNLVGKEFADCFSKHHLFSWLEGREGEIEAIFHMGACSNTVETDADYLLENNFKYTVKLASWAVKANARFIYASSAATYGSGELGFVDDEARLEELRPLNMYGFSKHLADLWLKREGLLDRVVGLKYFNVFGPNEYHKGMMASMVFKMVGIAQNEGKIELFKSNDPKYEDGGQLRDFIYVKDAVKMSCLPLEPSFRKIGGIFNIGQGKPTTWNAMAKALTRALSQKIDIHYIDMPEALKRQYQNYTCASMEKFHKIFSGFAPVTDVNDAVHEYVTRYLLRHERW